MSGPRGWARDLGLGVRLAFGGGTAAWSRLALTAVGVGLGLAVLLLAAALPMARAAQETRGSARVAVVDQREATGPVQLRLDHLSMEFRTQQLRVDVLDPVVPEPALPPGLHRLPGHGAMVVSPALAQLLASPDGALLRPRLPWTQVGLIGQEGLLAPGELAVYASEPLDPGVSDPVYGWGVRDDAPLRVEMVLLALVGSVVVLVPVLVLIAATTRVAAAARERRLAALRLVGADAGQVRRLASGEALVGAVGGVLLGLVFFLLGRELVARVSVLGLSVFAADLVPATVPTVLAVLVVPVLAVFTAVLSLRQVVAQPLGVSRQSTPPRRRLWWRLAPLVVGAALLGSQAGAFAGDPGEFTVALVLVGIALTGLSVPVLLPWLVQRAVDPLAGGPPSWQLAVRRIQLDSATPARAAGGLAAVLTAAVAFQTLLASAFVQTSAWDAQQVGDQRGRIVQVFGVDADDEQRLHDLTAMDGVLNVRTYRRLLAVGGDGAFVEVFVASCEVLRSYAHLDRCAPGDAFRTESPGEDRPVKADLLRFQGKRGGSFGSWQVPATAATVRLVDPDGPLSSPGALLATDSAIPAGVTQDLPLEALVLIDPDAPDMYEHVANALTPLGRRVLAYALAGGDKTLTQLRNSLLAGALVVLLLAAASLLIVSVEQVRERRRQLAALAASGVSGRTLGASVLWQATVPFGVATVASLGVGTGLGMLLMRTFDGPAVIDWSGMAILVAATTVAVLLVTALTLPSLRRATRPEGLRTE